MTEAPKPRPVFWPMLFIGAFALGAILWGIWMVRLVRQTRETRDNSFKVLINTNPLPIVPGKNTTPSGSSTPPAGGLSTGKTNGMVWIPG